MIIAAEDLTVSPAAVIEVKERERRRPVRVVEHGGGAAAADVKRGGGRTRGRPDEVCRRRPSVRRCSAHRCG